MDIRTSWKNKKLFKALDEEYRQWDGVSEYEPNDYQIGRQNAKLNKQLLFIHGKPSGKRTTAIEELVNKALEKGFKIALIDKWKNKFGENEAIFYTEKNSVEYFKLLTEAKYIYATSNLNYNFSKTDKQILIVDLPSYDREDFDNRIKVDSILCHADYVVKGKKTRKEIFEGMLGKNLKANVVRADKERVLFIINTSDYDRTLEYILSIQNQFDYSKYDVTVLFAVTVKERFRKQMEMLNSDIHVIFRRGNVVCDAETYRKLAFIEEKNYELPDVAVVNKFLGSDVYIQEAKRLFGTRDFDYVFNMRFYGIKWRLLIHALQGRKIFYNFDSYNYSSSRSITKLEQLNMYDEILFPNYEICNMAIEFSSELFADKSYVVANVCAEAQEKTNATNITLGGEAFCIADTFTISGGDSINALMIKCPKEKTPYIIIDPRCTELYAAEQLKEILNKGIHPIVFDFGKILLDNRVINKIDYYVRYSSLGALSPILGDEIRLEPDTNVSGESSLDVMVSGHKNNV